jgi:hypothetical protein
LIFANFWNTWISTGISRTLPWKAYHFLLLLLVSYF